MQTTRSIFPVIEIRVKCAKLGRVCLQLFNYKPCLDCHLNGIQTARCVVLVVILN